MQPTVTPRSGSSSAASMRKRRSSASRQRSSSDDSAAAARAHATLVRDTSALGSRLACKAEKGEGANRVCVCVRGLLLTPASVHSRKGKYIYIYTCIYIYVYYVYGFTTLRLIPTPGRLANVWCNLVWLGAGSSAGV
eukprot:362267-Chlamydomonas_euryale.AAC.1